MNVVLLVLSSLILCGVAGFAVVAVIYAFFDLERKRSGLSFTFPAIGYAVLQFLFVTFYQMTERSRLSIKLTMLAGSLLLFISILLYFLRSKNKLRWNLRAPSKTTLLAAVALIAVFVLAAWPYVTIGMGHYYHSGNEDFFDGIAGGASYVHDTPVELQHPDYKDNLRIQYSSQAFWTVLFGLAGMDSFLLNAILNLLLLSLGVFWLVRFVFGGDDIAAAIIAVLAVGSHFYFTTFLAGHIGSMMYNSVAPVLLGLVLLWNQRVLSYSWLFLAGFLYYFLSNTYPGPFYFLALPLVVVVLHERVLLPFGLWKRAGKLVGLERKSTGRLGLTQIRWMRVALLVAISLAGLVVLARFARSTIENRQLFQMLLLRTQVSWGVALTKEILPVFLGIYPSNLVGTASPMRTLVSDNLTNWAAMTASVALAVSSLAAAFSFLKSRKTLFLGLYVLALPGFYYMMREFWGSPYYVYKFLYINMFVVIIALGLWISTHLRARQQKKNWLIVAPLAALIALNLFWDTKYEMDIVRRPYHHVDAIEGFFQSVPSEMIKSAALDIPNEVNRVILQHLLTDRGVSFLRHRDQATYLVQFSQFRTVAYCTSATDSVLYDNGLLRLAKKPMRDDIQIVTRYETDNLDDFRVNWIGNELSEMADRIRLSLNDLTSYIRDNNIAQRTHLDIRAPHIEALVALSLDEAGVPLQIDPQKSKWFIRLRFTESAPLQWRATLFKTTGKETVLYMNRLFQIVEVPPEGRVVSDDIADDIQRSHSALMLDLRRVGNSVCLDLPPYEHSTLFLKQLLIKQGVALANSSDANLFLRLTLPAHFEYLSFKSVTHPKERVIWESSSDYARGSTLGLQLVEIPTSGRIITHDPERDSLQYRLLVSPRFGDFQIYVRYPSPNANYLRLLVEPGPSIDMKDFNLAQLSPVGEVVNRWRVYAPVTCVDVNLKKVGKTGREVVALNFEGENLIGKSLLPVEERLLNYGLLAAELTDSVEKYSDPMISALDWQRRLEMSSNFAFRERPTQRDIIENESKGKLHLATGWYPYEVFAGTRFRWVRNDAQILIVPPSSRNRELVVTLERGPSLVKSNATLFVSLNNNVIDSLTLSGTHRLKVSLPAAMLKGNDIVTLHLDSVGRAIPGDERILDFRVFNISLQDR